MELFSCTLFGFSEYGTDDKGLPGTTPASAEREAAVRLQRASRTRPKQDCMTHLTPKFWSWNWMMGNDGKIETRTRTPHISSFSWSKHIWFPVKIFHFSQLLATQLWPQGLEEVPKTIWRKKGHLRAVQRPRPGLGMTMG